MLVVLEVPWAQADTELCALADEKVPKKPAEGLKGDLPGSMENGCWGS